MAKITLYTVSAAGSKAIEKEELGPQATLVLSTLAKKADGMTSSDLSAKVESSKKLTTKQPVKRVVGFYLAQFKADGLVKVKVEKTADEKPVKKAAAKKTASKKSSKKTAPAAEVTEEVAVA